MGYQTGPLYSGSTTKDLTGSTLGDALYTTSATQLYTLGTLHETEDGRRFRYAKAGANALVQAFMTVTATQDSKFFEIAQTAHPQTAGSYKITVLCTTGSASAENDFSGGWLVCNKVSPAVVGDIYGIVASKLQSTDTLLDLTLATPWRNAMLATGEVSLCYNQFFKTVVHPTSTPTAQAAGVPLVAVPAGYYYWSQVRGPAPLIVDTGETVLVGQPVGVPLTSDVAGACGPLQVDPTLTAATKVGRTWGVAMSVAAAAEPSIVNLCLE